MQVIPIKSPAITPETAADMPFTRFSQLADFLLFYKESLLQEPYRGKVMTLWALFIEFCKNEDKAAPITGPAAFAQFLVDFNDVTADALGLTNFVPIEQKSLEWINLENIQILKRRLQNPHPVAFVAPPLTAVSESTDPFQSLISYLDAPLRTKANEKQATSYDYDYERLWKSVSETTAMVKLGSARARLLTPQSPFFEVCEQKRHIDVMTTTFFNTKVLGVSNDIPSSGRVAKLFASAQHLIDQETLQCIKTKTHYLPLITNYTDVHLGNCSYLDTCHKLKNCRYVHYFTMHPTQPKNKEQEKPTLALDYTIGECHDSVSKKVMPAQWINCDVRHLSFSILGKFAAIISDPAWDIHMALPYGTCKDTELLSLPMKELQDEGIICLWVTGRSIEIGRKALALWGYTVCDEVIWIKTNQLNRTIVTGRTGHWLNHSKEHLLIGVKGNPIWLNRKIDVDFIVSGTRETLRKPDELYEIVERIVGKHARKLEIFGRDNNIRPGWVSMFQFFFLF